jgi:plastocyanin
MVQVGITGSFARVLSRPGVRPLAMLLSAAIAAAAVIPTSAAVATGRVEGVVRLVASNEPPIASGAYPSRRVSHPAPRTSEIGNVIVFIKDAPAPASLAPGRARMTQVDESFSPRVVAITRGSTIEFPNADPYFHNVFSLSRGATFDLGRYPRGQSRTRVFTQPGLVKVYCHLHSHMSASIMVFDHPYFTVPSNDGSFALADVPPGDYRVSAWHERIGESPKAIHIEAGSTVRIEFSLPVETQ